MNLDSYRGLLDDLRAEGDELAAALVEIPDERWTLPTPATGWTIHDQVVHLMHFDQLARLALRCPADFARESAAEIAAGPGWIDRISFVRRGLPPSELLEQFASGRSALLGSFADTEPTARSPWFGRPMSAASSASARLMETWAHGQDIHDAMGVSRLPSQRVRHVCHLGVLTRKYSFCINDRPEPVEDVRVELVSPEGKLWVWGPEDASNRVVGDAWDFALVVTQRRDVGQTRLTATPGPAADWLAIAQAFAGDPGRLTRSKLARS
ncbi:TIGR03084 family metal-binding protein [Nakamurella panacisegetis]|nr:TIGR03084 family metal-binding protein [Nakamurella panacisegetis]